MKKKADSLALHVRLSTGLSQTRFADTYMIDVSALRAWEASERESNAGDRRGAEPVAGDGAVTWRGLEARCA